MIRTLKITRSITNRDNESIDKYLKDVGKEILISPEEEADLAKRVRNGDNEALEKLIRANLRFVVSVAKQYQNQGLSLSDLINEGNLGLIKAAEKFDETRGFKFISYAVWWIRQSILQALAENSRIVRLPLNQVNFLQRVLQEYNRLELELGRSPFPREIAENLEISEERVLDILKYSKRPLSLDAPVADEDDREFSDVLENQNNENTDDNLIYESLAYEIKRFLETIPDRERKILEYYFGINGQIKTIDEIASIFNLSRERTRQIKNEAIILLRQKPLSHRLKHYLG